MWSHLDERCRSNKHQFNRFGLANSNETRTCSPPHPPVRSSAQEWHRASNESSLAKAGIAAKTYDTGPRYSLRGSQALGSVELSPFEPDSCIQEELDRPSVSVRLGQTVQDRQHPNNNEKPIAGYFLRRKKKSLDRSGSLPQVVQPVMSHPSSRTIPKEPTGAPGQLQTARRIPELFKAKRPSHSDPERVSKKPCVRPTLASALGGNFAFAQEQSARKDEFCAISSQMTSVFDMPCQQQDQVNQENLSIPDMTMQAEVFASPGDLCDMMPCFMAPAPNSPSEPVAFASGLHIPSAGILTPDAIGHPSMSVHTPPECMPVVPELPPGAPRKKTRCSNGAGSSSSMTMSADSFDACESVFAPGAPDWSPREGVVRVLRFDLEDSQMSM